MVSWAARAVDITAATQVYAGLTTTIRGTTATSPKVPTGYGHIKYIVANIGVDAAITADVGNLFVLKLSGNGLLHGEQEILVGALSTSETAVAVTDLLMTKPAFILQTNIWTNPGEPIDMSALYMGSDSGSQIVTAALGFERGRGGVPLQYRTRGDSQTQATDIYEALETKPETTAGTGSYEAPGGSSMISRLIAAAVLNADADTIIAIQPWHVEVSGDAIGATPQEIPFASLGADEGAGVVTSVHNILFNPTVVPAEVPLTGGNSFNVATAYKGTDLGTPFTAVTVEIAGRFQARSL